MYRSCFSLSSIQIDVCRKAKLNKNNIVKSIYSNRFTAPKCRISSCRSKIDLYKRNFTTIQELPKKNLTSKEEVIKGFGQLTAATFYHSRMNPSNWLMFEKYDGVRAYWDPKEKSFISRRGNKLRIPEEIVNTMPDFALDGELWFGRGRQSEALKISAKANFSIIDWKSFKYMVFDFPVTDNETYQERYNQLNKLVDPNHKWITVAPTIICKDLQHMQSYAKGIIGEGGEGIILRDPNATYKQGASRGYVKFKVYRDDEARFIEQIGPNTFQCELPNGVLFEAPADDSLLKEELKKGDIVSYKYTLWNSKTKQPHSPILYRLRSDITWEDVINNFENKRKVKRTTPVIKSIRKDRHEHGYWSIVENQRKFFENFAKEKGFDPFVPDNWYNFSRNDIVKSQGIGPFCIKNYQSLRQALTGCFPEIPWDVNQFNKRNYWTDPQNCKTFFYNLAKSLGMDPEKPDTWYNITKQQIAKHGGAGILKNYDWSIKKAIMNNFPELNLDVTKFKDGYWKSLKNLREWFIDLAKSKGFDPFVPDNWYNLTRDDIMKEKSGNVVLLQFRNSYAAALLLCFPELPWEIPKLFKPGKGPKINLMKDMEIINKNLR